jgi:hypothetical protein
MTTIRNVDTCRSINDLSGNDGSSTPSGITGNRSRNHHHHHYHHHHHHRFHKRCRHNCNTNTASSTLPPKRNKGLQAGPSTTPGNKPNNNGTVVNATKETNYIHWRRNQYLFNFNETNNDNVSASEVVVQGQSKKETMDTSVDL